MIDALVDLWLDMLISWLTGTERRRQGARLRHAKQKRHELRVANAATARAIARSRRGAEYLRRGALMRYWDAEHEFIEASLDALEGAKRTAFERLHAIEAGIRGPRNQREVVRAELHQRYRDVHGRMHWAIADSKVLTTLLLKQRAVVRHELRRLGDASTHGRLGAKKKIEELLQAAREVTRARLRDLHDGDGELVLHHVAYTVDEQCRGCDAHIASAMAYCPLCVSPAARLNRRQRFFKKDVKGTLSCGACNAPCDASFARCFNCSEAIDAYGLIAVLEAGGATAR